MIRLFPITICILLAALAWPGAALPARAQTPFLADEEKFGRQNDENTLQFCVDRRDPGWEVDQHIGEAIAGALLLEPDMHVIESEAEREELDNVYRHLLADCRIYFGFKLVPELYPNWLAISRPYYEVGYVFVVADPNWHRLADIPRSLPLAPTLGSVADFSLVQYLSTLPEGQRWPRFPMTSDAAAVQAVIEGEVAAALVWAPSFAALASANPEYGNLRVIAPDPLPDLSVPVGAAMISRETFLRSNVDEAIAALLSDGTLERIIADSGFPATLPQ